MRRRVAVAGGPVKRHGAVTCRKDRGGVRRHLEPAGPPAPREASRRHAPTAPPWAAEIPGLYRPVLPFPRCCCPPRGEKARAGRAPSFTLPPAHALRKAAGAGRCGWDPVGRPPHTHTHHPRRGERRAGQPAPRGGKSEVSFVFKENRSASVIKRMFSLIVAHIKEEDSHLLSVLLCRFQFRSYPLIFLTFFFFSFLRAAF